MVHSHLPPSTPSLNGTRGMGTLLIFSVKSSTLSNDIETLHNVRPQKLLPIVWKQKHQSEHRTCDKKILTPPSIRIFPLFGELKKDDFFTPLLPVWTNVSFSAIFFWKASLILLVCDWSQTTP